LIPYPTGLVNQKSDQFIYIILEIFSKTGKNQDALWQVRMFFHSLEKVQIWALYRLILRMGERTLIPLLRTFPKIFKRVKS